MTGMLIVSVIPFFITGFKLGKEIMRKENAEYIKAWWDL